MSYLFLISEIIRFPDVENRNLGYVCSAYFKEFNRTAPVSKGRVNDPNLCMIENYNTEEDSNSALSRANYYRHLVGYTLKNELNLDDYEKHSKCCIYMQANNEMTHYPSSNKNCYSKDASDSCQYSNLAWHSWIDGSTYDIDMYMKDGNTPSVGHRSWVLNPGTRQFTFCETGYYGALRVRGFSKIIDPEWIPFAAYPNPGFAPIQMGANNWSFGASMLSRESVITVKLDSRAIGLEFEPKYYSGYGAYPVLVFKPSVVSNTGTYEITVDDKKNSKTYQYIVRFHTCQQSDLDSDETADSNIQHTRNVNIGLGVGVPVIVAVVVIGVVFLIRKINLKGTDSNDIDKKKENSSDSA